MRGHEGRVLVVALAAAGHLVSAGTDGAIQVWESQTGALLRTLRADRPFERMDITGLAGLTDAQHDALLVLGAVDHATETA
jgi:hypothetical protein